MRIIKNALGEYVAFTDGNAVYKILLGNSGVEASHMSEYSFVRLRHDNGERCVDGYYVIEDGVILRSTEFLGGIVRNEGVKNSR